MHERRYEVEAFDENSYEGCQPHVIMGSRWYKDGKPTSGFDLRFYEDTAEDILAELKKQVAVVEAFIAQKGEVSR